MLAHTVDQNKDFHKYTRDCWILFIAVSQVMNVNFLHLSNLNGFSQNHVKKLTSANFSDNHIFVVNVFISRYEEGGL